MSESLLTILKLCLLALLYLFFFRVLRAVWAELRAAGAGPAAPPDGRRRGRQAVAPAPAAVAAGAPAPAGAPAAAGGGRRERGGGPRSTPTELVVIEGRDRGAVHAIGGELTIGRAGGCAISLPHDTFVSSLHARVYRDPGGGVLVEDLGSTNGTSLNGSAVTGPVPVGTGDRVKVGSTILEAR